MEETRRLIWNGEIPLEIHLNDPEGILVDSVSTAIVPFYMMAGRLSYFPLLANEIRRNFGSLSRARNLDNLSLSLSASNASISASSASVSTTATAAEKTFHWFTFKMRSIPAHLPIGLVYDIFRAFHREEVPVPWKIEFHISHSSPQPQPQLIFPASSAIVDEAALTAFYFSSLKEADHLRSGSARNVMNLSRVEQLQLWESLKNRDFDRFSRINQKIINFQHSNTRCIPIKFWIICQKQQNVIEETSTIDRFQFPILTSKTEIQSVKDLLESEFSIDFLKRISYISIHGVQVSFQDTEAFTMEELNLAWSHGDNFINLLIVILK